MRVLVAGATGIVGQQVVALALRRGHKVIAVCRRPQSLTLRHDALRVVAADILDAAEVEPLLAGVDAVISAVGIGTSKQPTTLYSQGTRNLVAGMEQHGVTRLVTISAEPADHWVHRSWFKRWVLFPLLQRAFGASYDDMRRMDVVLWESSVQWTTVRAPRIRDRVGSGSYRIDVNAPLRRGLSITAPDLASALLDIAEREDLGRRFVFVAN